jgi:methylamine methyltransferase corrinoid protein reductive activase
MTQLVIAMDLGTSGFRAQALDLSNGQVLSTAITTRHPLPGANVIDHLHFALEVGVAVARDLMVEAVNQLIKLLRVPFDDVLRLAVCGNPTQLSLFQGIEIRDLAYAGSRKLQALGVTPPERTAAIRCAGEFPGLVLPRTCVVIIPPAVHDEVGADALALILQTGMLHCDETSIAIDYGTNAEMALAVDGRIYTGSAAAGPALEGQHISCGTLATPQAISDLEPVGEYHRLVVLNAQMQPLPGALVDLREPGDVIAAAGPLARAITGTGVIAALDQGLEADLIVLPRIQTSDRQLHFGKNIFLTETDLTEAGKAIGAVRAGYFTLCLEAGITPADVHTAYLAGASGTYMDAQKAGRLGLIPPGVKTVRQVGNTSLAMARDLVVAPEKLEVMNDLARRLRQTHCMFAMSKIFSRLYILELAHWTEGMPMDKYRELLRRYRLPDLVPMDAAPQVIRTVKQDIDDLGTMGLTTLECVGRVVTLHMDGCSGCMSCLRGCPAQAISVHSDTQPPWLSLAHALCNGVACRRCESGCPTKVFHLNAFFEAATLCEAATESPPLRN